MDGSLHGVLQLVLTCLFETARACADAAPSRSRASRAPRSTGRGRGKLSWVRAPTLTGELVDLEQAVRNWRCMTWSLRSAAAGTSSSGGSRGVQEIARGRFS